ncbi:hypothetical protein [Amycolatopsis sp. CA-230715]|uniref:hypothetical protein n=1 Tax=Amycolatopsis sp. CA-230715 TaxID=2745196 RepID=UPI001C02474D|nr:hypothetical protein [Amycolatopsis sp. CA-230715]QWF77905.1 hypothetical protein HUW46_01298 [Amycolatopsis sp. CA-230715]
MNDQELTALRRTAANEVLFHRGTWGGPAGYRWRGQDGLEAGVVPQWTVEALDGLAARGLIATEHRLGPLDVGVTVTTTGLDALGCVPER